MKKSWGIKMVKTQIIKRIKWYFGSRKYPKPALFFSTDNWVTDPKEIERIIRENGMEL